MPNISQTARTESRGICRSDSRTFMDVALCDFMRHGGQAVPRVVAHERTPLIAAID
jgi:hypothetical protein